MTVLEAIDARHSVRAYKTEPIPEEVRTQLNDYVADCNTEGNLNISIQYDDPAGFDSRLAHYGSFRNVQNYIVLAGKQDEGFDFRCGYYGEKIVLFAQQLGLEKKTPELWREAARRNGVQPESCTIFDDSLAACQGARRARMRVVGVYDSFFASDEREMRHFCDVYIKSFEELLYDPAKKRK
jgi:hypothetical protein